MVKHALLAILGLLQELHLRRGVRAVMLYRLAKHTTDSTPVRVATRREDADSRCSISAAAAMAMNGTSYTRLKGSKDKAREYVAVCVWHGTGAGSGSSNSFDVTLTDGLLCWSKKGTPTPPLRHS